MMAPGTVKRLPIVKLNVDGKLGLYFADVRLGEYRHIKTMHRVGDDECQITMPEMIKRFRVTGMHKETVKKIIEGGSK